MKRVLSADFFELRKSKIVYILPLVSVLIGFLLPLTTYGIYTMFKYLGSMEGLEDAASLASAAELLDALTAKAVFLSSLPLSQGIGIVATAMIGFRAVRPFGTGVYRNKVIAQIPRGAIYLSQSFYCLILMMLSACLYTFSAALASRLTFGELGLSGREIAVTALLSFGIYLVYTAIPVFIAFLTRSVPLSILISMLLPVLTQTVVSFAGAALASAPAIVAELAAILPAVQNNYLLSAQASDTVLAISLSADVAITALLTLLGILCFRKTDIS